MDNTYTFIDLFAGCGGLSLGFEKAGFEGVLAIDNWKEWIAAEQYGDYYNIYRVYFTKSKTIIVRIQNPYKLSENGDIEVFPTIFQMNFSNSVISKFYEQTV